MLDILARLTAIKHYSKDIHYNAKGDVISVQVTCLHHLKKY